MSRLRDFNLLKVADVSSNSTTNNNVSVVVNADSSGNSQTNNEFAKANAFPSENNVNFTQRNPLQPDDVRQGLQTPIFPPSLDPQNVSYPSNQAPAQVQELEYRLNNAQNELKFYKLLSATLSNILKDNNPRLVINLIDNSGKIVIDAATLIELIAIKTNTDANAVNIQYKDEEPTCISKVNPIRKISNIKINNETFSLKYNAEYNILQDDFNISLDRCIIPIPIQYGH